MRFKVPQDVQQADKIVGPLTAVQLVEAVVGGGIAYFFFTRFGMPVGLLLAIIIAGLTIVFIFVRMYEMSFPQFLAAVALYMFRPRIRTWKKLSDVIFPTLTPAAQAAGQQTKQAAAVDAAKPQRSLSQLSKLLDADPLRRHAPTEADVPDDAVLAKQQTLAGIHAIDEKLRTQQARAAKSNPNALPPNA